MPSTTVEIRREVPPEVETRIIEAVQSALEEGFRIPPDDRCVRLVVHPPHRFVVPPKRSPDL